LSKWIFAKIFLRVLPPHRTLIEVPADQALSVCDMNWLILFTISRDPSEASETRPHARHNWVFQHHTSLVHPLLPATVVLSWRQKLGTGPKPAI
jgi:hypothetical protein